MSQYIDKNTHTQTHRHTHAHTLRRLILWEDPNYFRPCFASDIQTNEFPLLSSKVESNPFGGGGIKILYNLIRG
jgi:hypothetical protein